MATTKHTAGDWIIGLFEFPATRHYVAAAVPSKQNHQQTKYIAELEQTHGAEEVQANARLIATAPEMLKVLCDVSDYWTNEESVHHIDALKAGVRAAIAKATGEA